MKVRLDSRAFHPKGDIEFFGNDTELISFKRKYKGEEKTVVFNLSDTGKVFQGRKILPFELQVF